MFTLQQDFAFAKLAMYSNVIDGKLTGENTIGLQDEQTHWHPSNDEMAYRWWSDRNGVPLSSFVWPTSYVLRDDVSNGYHGIRVFDDAGNWLGTPNAPLPKTAPAVVKAVVAPAPVPTAPAVPAVVPLSVTVPKAAQPVTIASPAASQTTPTPEQTAPVQVQLHVQQPAPAVAPVDAAPAPAPKAGGFWAWLRHLFHW